jgi:RNA polymerase sigma-54 factor
MTMEFAHQTLGQEPGVRHELRASPTVVLFAQLLSLNSEEIRARIEAEAESNGALEVEERPVCHRCGRSDCASGMCLAPSRGLGDPEHVRREREPSCDPFADLSTQVRLLLHPRHHALADYVLGCLDDRGFLDAPVADIAEQAGTSETGVRTVVAAIREVGPPGIAACNLGECLLLQLRTLPLAPAIAPEIVAHHLDDLGAGRYERIAAALGVETSSVIAAHDYIRGHLRPYAVVEPTDSRVSRPPPDVVVVDDDGTLDVELIEERRFLLFVSPSYARATAGYAHLTPADRAKIEGDVRRARDFIAWLTGRWSAMRRIATYVVRAQERFVREGVTGLVPLTRAEVAARLGLHESTVGRAVANRSVMLLSGKVVPFEEFFKPSRGAHEALRRLIATEERPRSDAELARLLAASGYNLARRTVAKYRADLGIPEARAR